jgi:hypothetical protein
VVTAAPASQQGVATAMALEVIIAIVAKITHSMLPNAKVARMIAQAAKVTPWTEIIVATV